VLKARLIGGDVQYTQHLKTHFQIQLTASVGLIGHLSTRSVSVPQNSLGMVAFISNRFLLSHLHLHGQRSTIF